MRESVGVVLILFTVVYFFSFDVIQLYLNVGRLKILCEPSVFIQGMECFSSYVNPQVVRDRFSSLPEDLVHLWAYAELQPLTLSKKVTHAFILRPRFLSCLRLRSSLNYNSHDVILDTGEGVAILSVIASNMHFGMFLALFDNLSLNYLKFVS